MSYVADVILWLAAGTLAGVFVGEGIWHLKRVAARNSRR